jgi:hypothetical protein
MQKLGLLIIGILLFSSCHQSGSMDEYNDCGLEGDAKRADVRGLNTHKNRYDFPDSTQIDHLVTLQAMLAPGDDRNRFQMDKAAEITGYVIDVKVGGDESCNCHARNMEDRDTHIELVIPLNEIDDKNVIDEKNCVIVEITPRMRAIMAQKGIDWSTDNIRKTYKGHMVKVSGWLLFDEEHINQAINTAPDNFKDWRTTCWELHPVTSIELADNPL